MHWWGALKIVSTVLFSVNSHLEWTVQSLGLQVPDVNTVVKTSTDQKLRGGAQTHAGLPFLNRGDDRGALICDSLTFTGNKSQVINSPDSDITNLWYVCVYRHKCTMCSCTNNSRSGHWLTPSASSTTGTGVALRLETTSLSPQLLALTKYWSEGTAQDCFAFEDLHKPK